MKAVKKTATILVSVILWAIILLAALFAFTTLATRDQNNVSRFVGFTPLSVLTDSMSPTFNSGDLIIIQRCDPATLQKDDIITFHTIINNEYTLNTHRIHEILTEGGVRSYVTKGDNNAIADTHIIADGDIVGKYVFRLAGVGKVMDFLSSSLGFLLVIVLPMLLFFVYQVYHLISVSISLKKAVALEEAEEKAEAESKSSEETAALLAEAERLKAETEAAEKARAEAEAALAEARRLKEEAEAALAEAKENKEEEAEAALAEAKEDIEEEAEAALAEAKENIEDEPREIKE